MTRSTRAGAMTGKPYVGRRGCHQGGSTLAVGCGNPLTYRRNTRPLPESPFFADSSVLHASRQRRCPKKRRAMSWSHHNSTPLFGIGLALYRARQDGPLGTMARGGRARGAGAGGAIVIVRCLVDARGPVAIPVLAAERAMVRHSRP